MRCIIRCVLLLRSHFLLFVARMLTCRLLYNNIPFQHYHHPHHPHCPAGKYLGARRLTSSLLRPVRIVTNTTSTAEELLERLYGYPKTPPRKRRLADNGSPGPAHHHYPCTDCPKGFITTTTHENKCPACSTGLYQASNGQTSCPGCPVGWKQASTGQAACVQWCVFLHILLVFVVFESSC